MLEAAHLTRDYGDVIIVDDFSFPIAGPELHGAHPGEAA